MNGSIGLVSISFGAQSEERMLQSGEVREKGDGREADNANEREREGATWNERGREGEKRERVMTY